MDATVKDIDLKRLKLKVTISGDYDDLCALVAYLKDRDENGLATPAYNLKHALRRMLDHVEEANEAIKR